LFYYSVPSPKRERERGTSNATIIKHS
jgi:hypothetical protein